MPVVAAILLASLLALATGFDVVKRRIPNAIPVALLLTGVSVAVVQGGPRAALLSVAAAAGVGVVLAGAWRRGLLGAGDVKLAAATVAWLGVHDTPVFLLATALAGGVVSAASWIASGRDARRAIAANLLAAGVAGTSLPPYRGRASLPYAVAIAAGALTTIAWRT